MAGVFVAGVRHRARTLGGVTEGFTQRVVRIISAAIVTIVIHISIISIIGVGDRVVTNLGPWAPTHPMVHVLLVTEGIGGGITVTTAKARVRIRGAAVA